MNLLFRPNNESNAMKNNGKRVECVRQFSTIKVAPEVIYTTE